jgi:hypothetical protein
MATPWPIRLPRQWKKHVRCGVLHAISLASTVLTVTHCAATGRRRLQSELERARTEVALLREELCIKDGRWERSRFRRRPHYTPIQRMRILQLRAARGWNLEQTARVFLADLRTLVARCPGHTLHNARDVCSFRYPSRRCGVRFVCTRPGTTHSARTWLSPEGRLRKSTRGERQDGHGWSRGPNGRPNRAVVAHVGTSFDLRSARSRAASTCRSSSYAALRERCTLGGSRPDTGNGVP